MSVRGGGICKILPKKTSQVKWGRGGWWQFSCFKNQPKLLTKDLPSFYLRISLSFVRQIYGYY